MMIEEKSPDQLMRDDAIRQALERAARAIESRAGNAVYKRAWIIAARIIRSFKPN